MDTGEVEYKGVFERIGYPDAFYRHEHRGNEVRADVKASNHEEAAVKLFELLGDCIKDVKAIGHRVVHGGEKYMASVVATEEVLKGVEGVSHFAPLHNPANLMGVRACMKVLPSVPNVLVFDTAFHSTLAPHVYRYAIPTDDYKQHGVRRYGFHGTSYSYCMRTAADLYGKKPEELRMVILHLGGGASICAVNKGKSVETSMGMTPLEGLIMGTRAGDIDAGVVAYLAKVKNQSAQEVVDYLNKSGGLKGLTGDSDIRNVLAGMEKGCADNQLCYDAVCHRLTKYIGGYIAIMGGVDLIVWSGGIGTNNLHVRRDVMKNFKFIGAEIDNVINEKFHGDDGGRNMTGEISKKGSAVRTFVVATNEELEIALEAERLVK